jgi:hypothetical protein
MSKYLVRRTGKQRSQSYLLKSLNNIKSCQQKLNSPTGLETISVTDFVTLSHEPWRHDDSPKVEDG